jgi:metal-responsive CopG/Arc/MetJ family transcriptional regulator
MSTSRTRTSRVFTISFPDALAREVEQVAKEESRNISEIFRESFRLYKLQAIEKHIEASRRRALANPSPGRQEEIEAYVDEVRRARASGKKV